MFLFLISLLFSMSAQGAINLPSNLTDGEQRLVYQSLGFGTSFHPVNSHHPLGVRNGFEFGISVHSLPTGDIGYYGSQTLVANNTLYPSLNVGKGIGDSLDVFFSFVPINESTGISSYSGAIRWALFQPTFVPAHFSLLTHLGSANLNNLLISQTMGADLIVGVDFDPFSFYFGGGSIYGRGTFSRSVTTTGTAADQTSTAFHTIIGMSIAVKDFFLAGEVDTYNNTVGSLKLGIQL